jgi:hypothetical protein
MSPVNDDVIFFTVLAAGLRPVMAPVSSDDGNLEPGLVSNQVWSSLAGVLTTNLYGLPDRVQELRSRCNQLGIPLIEDAAHAIETQVDGRLIGTYGDAAVFSFSKHLDAHCGGLIAFGNEAHRAELEVLRRAATFPAQPRDQVMRVAAHGAEGLVIGLHLVWPVRWLRRTLRLTERAGFRMPLRPIDLNRAIAAASGLEAFHTWIRVDRNDYYLTPPAWVLERTLRRLEDLDADCARRIEGVRRLRSLPIAAPAVRRGDPQPLFRVPLLVDERTTVAAKLERRLTAIGYIYDPPLDDYAGPQFADPSPAPDTARWWASHVFPVDPLEADRVLQFFGSGRPAAISGSPTSPANE